MKTLSKRNPYWIERHRFFELKHFCLQYPIWKKAYASLDGLSKKGDLYVLPMKNYKSPTERCAIAKTFYSERIKMVEDAAKEAAGDLAVYILEGVTTGASYETIKARLDIPCCRDVYYEMFRKFFWVLNRLRA